MIKKFTHIFLLSISYICLSAQTFDDPVLLIEDTEGNSLSYVFLAGDLNNDGNIDLVGQGFESSDFKYFFNRGDNTFDEELYPSGNSFTPIAIADFNNDGWPDVLGHSRMIATNEGDGTFDYIFEVSSDPNLDKQRVGVADFNNDGNLDILSIPSVSFEKELYWHSGNGNFEFSPMAAEVDEEHNYASIVDFNEDGYPDIVSANQFSKGQFKLMLNDGTGDFELYRDLRDIYVSETDRFADMADIDQDGDYEIIGVSQSSGPYYVNNMGDDEFSLNPTFMNQFYTGNIPISVLVEDINGDGYPDVVSYDDNGEEYAVYVYINDKNGGFTSEEPLILIEKYSGFVPINYQVNRHLIQLIDADGDDVLDLIINDTKNGQIYIAYNTNIASNLKELSIEEIELYPNPANNKLLLNPDFTYDEFNIVDMQGAIVKSGNQQKQIDISNLAFAQYYIIIKKEGKAIAKGSFLRQ